MSERKKSEALTIPEFTENKDALDWLLVTFPSTETFATFVTAIGLLDWIELRLVLEDAATYCADPPKGMNWPNMNIVRFNQEQSFMLQCLQNRAEALQQRLDAIPPIADPKDDLQVLLRRVQAGENAVKLVQELDATQCTKFMSVLGGFIAVRKAIHQMGETGILDPAISTNTANTLYTELNRRNWECERAEESPH